MAGKFRFGYFTQIVQPISRRKWEETAGPNELRQIAEALDRFGYDVMTCGDHSIVPPDRVPFYGNPRFFDPMVTFGYLAACTKNIRFLNHVVVIPLRHPFVTAKQLATLDVLSGGRLVVGPGTGGIVPELNALGVPYEKRGGVTNDYLRAIKALWTQEVASYKGPYCQFENVIALPKPVQKPHPPMWIGGGSEACMRRAVNIGDGWIPYGTSLEQIEQNLIKHLTYARSLLGWEKVADRFEVVPPVAPLGGRGPLGQEPPPIKRPSEVSVGKTLEDIARLRRAGATRLLLDIPATSLNETLEDIEWFAKEVMPHVE